MSSTPRQPAARRLPSHRPLLPDALLPPAQAADRRRHRRARPAAGRQAARRPRALRDARRVADRGAAGAQRAGGRGRHRPRQGPRHLRGAGAGERGLHRQPATGLYEDVAARGHRLRSEVKKIGVAPADDTQAEPPRIDVGDPVVHIERLRFVSDEPWVFAVTDVPYWAAPGLEKEDLTDRSLYRSGGGVRRPPGARPPRRRGLARRRAHGADAGDPAHRPAAGAAQRLGRRRRPARRELRGVPPRPPQPVRGRAAPARGPAVGNPLMVLTDGS